MRQFGTNLLQVVQLGQLFYENPPLIDDLEEILDKYSVSTLQNPKSINLKNAPIEFKNDIYREIIFVAFKKLNYPFYSKDEIINPFFEYFDDRLEINTLQISTHQVNDNLYVVLNPYLYVVSQKSLALDIQKDLSSNFTPDQIKQKYYLKAIMTQIYLSNEKILIEDIIFGFDYQQKVHKDLTIDQYYLLKYKQIAPQSQFILQTNLKGGRKYIYPEFCYLIEEKKVYWESQKYCQVLVEWNEELSLDQSFVKYLQSYNMALTAQFQNFGMSFCNAGQFYFSSDVARPVQQLISINNRDEFEHFYHQIFLNDQVIFTTNLTINSWVIITNSHESFLMNESFKKFLFVIKQIVQKKRYELQEPQVITVQENQSEDEILKLLPNNIQLTMVCGSESLVRRIRTKFQYLCATKGIPTIFIEIPLIDRYIFQITNRYLGQMSVQQGSGLWTIKEINGAFGGQFKVISSLGFSIIKLQDKFIVAMTLSINKYLNKYISTFEVSENLEKAIKDCIHNLFFTFLGTYKSFPELVMILCKGDQSNHEILLNIKNIIKLTQQEAQSQISKPIQILIAIIKNEERIRGFSMPDANFNPLQTNNLQMGSFIQLNSNKYLIAIKKIKRACPFFSEIEIQPCDNFLNNNEQRLQIIQLIYRQIFLNIKLTYQTYLPAALDYAVILQRQIESWVINGFNLESLQNYKKLIQSGKLQYV